MTTKQKHSQSDVVLTKIAKVTGHAVEDLESDLYLEADLGLDSIKMVTLMNELMTIMPEEDIAAFEKKHPFDTLLMLDTVEDLVRVFQVEAAEEAINNVAFSEQSIAVADAQYPFFISQQAVSTLTICSSITVDGKMDIGRLWSSWAVLIKRYPALQAFFHLKGEGTSFEDMEMKVVPDCSPPHLTIEDIQHLGDNEKESWMTNLYESYLNDPIDLFTWPLHGLRVIQTGQQQYKIVLSIVHLISDGLSNQTFLKELLEIYQDHEEGIYLETEKLITVDEYNATIAALNSWSDQKEINAFKAFLKKQGREKYMFNPLQKDGRTYVHKHSHIQTNILKRKLNHSLSQLLLRQAKSLNASLFEVILTAYLKAIVSLSSAKGDVSINVPTGGKVYPHVDASHLFGTFAQNIAFTFKEDSLSSPLNTMVECVHQEMVSALSSGVDRAQCAAAARMAKDEIQLINGQLPEATAAFIRSSLKSNLYLSFVGETKFKGHYGDLSLQDYEAYTCTNPAAIDVVVEKFNGELILTANYDSGFFSKSYMEQHMATFLAQVEEIALLSLESEPEWPLEAKLPPLPAVTESELPHIIEALEAVLGRKLSLGDCAKDLEFDLGMDSLERIRVVMKLEQTYQSSDRERLFDCRTMEEMARVIEGKSSPLTEAKVPFQLIVEQSNKTPSAIAVAHHQQLSTYQHINESSNQLAHYLITAHAVKQGDLVGVMVEPGANMVVGMLAVLKAGAAYVPIDPSYPQDRIRQMVKQAGVEVLLTEKHGALTLEEQPLIQLVYMDGLEQEVSWRSYSKEKPNIDVSGHDLMAVIFTSGSTGKPKGVMLSHEGFMNRIEWHQSVFRLEPGERVAQKTSCCFDISVWELFWPLMYGGTLCPVEREVVKNPWGFADWVVKERVNILHFVPSMFGEFINAIQDDGYQFEQLRWLIFSGEALPLSVIKKWKARYGAQIGLANLYGPTEASIDVTCHIIPETYGEEEVSIPIGKPIEGASVYILDKHLNEVAAGDIGEMYIGGVQVAKGYLHDPQRSADPFIPNPFKEHSDTVLYRTGDLGSWRSDGEIDYHGRIDSQVKVRGYRVELGEIEAHLNGLPGVDEAAVLATENQTGHIKLIAYVAGKEQEHATMVSILRGKLPDYMLPHRFVWRTHLPKTINGKLDRTKLKADSPACLPLLPAQKWLLEYFEPPYAWTGYTQFVYKRELDIDVFNKALTQLMKQNEALRTLFVKEESGWKQQLVEEPVHVTCSFLDLTGSTDAYVKLIMSEKIEETIAELAIHQWPLWKVVVIKSEDQRYRIAFIGHHMIADIITNQVLFQEMWTLYGQFLSGAAIVEKKSTYKEFLLFMEEMKQANQEEYRHFWSDKLRRTHMEGRFQLHQDHLGTNNEGSARIKQFALSTKKTKQLMGSVKNAYQTKMYPLLVAPLYQMLKEVTGQSYVTVSHRVHGRDFGKGKTFMNTAGNFAVNFPLPIQLKREANWEDVIRNVKQELEQVPLGGVSYDLIAETLPTAYYPDAHLTGIRANYLGNRDVRSLSIFEMDPTQMDQRHSSSTQKRTCLLEFFFFVEGGELKLEIEYSQNLYKESSIETFGNAYMEQLEELMESAGSSSTVQPRVTISKGKREMEDKVVLVTGGGTGIGKAIALEMAAAGAQTIIASRKGSHLEATLAEMETFGTTSASYEADITKLDHVQQLFNNVIARYGQLDVLVNNAGITRMGAMETIPHEEWLKIIQVNLIGTYNMCYAALPYFKEQGSGKIINLGSDSSLIGYPLMTAYAASKHGVLGLTRSLAEEVKLDGIQVNAVCPAFVNTAMTPPAMRKNAIPVTQVAEVVSFLASDRSNSITGEEIKVYGKQDMHWFGSKQIPMVQAMLNHKEPIME